MDKTEVKDILNYDNVAIETLGQTESDDCISRQQAIEAIEDVDWYHVNSKGELVSGSTSDEKSWYKAEDIYKALKSLKPVTPPGKVLAKIKVDTEELVEKIKEECQHERTGEWLEEHSGNGWNEWTNYICSECNEKFNKFYASNYCPNCGARMKG